MESAGCGVFGQEAGEVEGAGAASRGDITEGGAGELDDGGDRGLVAEVLLGRQLNLDVHLAMPEPVGDLALVGRRHLNAELRVQNLDFRFQISDFRLLLDTPPSKWREWYELV